MLGAMRYVGRIAARLFASARVARESARPETAAALALVTRSRPEAREKLLATFLPTPSASRMPAVAPALATAPPAVIGMTPVAALRQSTQRAIVGEKAKPRALNSKVLPMARVVQQVKRYTPATIALRRRPGALCAETWWETRWRRGLRRSNGRRTSRALASSSAKQPSPKATTISSGPRKLAELVAVAEMDRGSIATASTIPSERIESAIASSPIRIPPSLRRVPILTR